MSKVRVILSLEMDVDLWADIHRVDGFFAARNDIRQFVTLAAVAAFEGVGFPVSVNVVEDKTITERNVRKRCRAQQPRSA